MIHPDTNFINFTVVACIYLALHSSFRRFKLPPRLHINLIGYSGKWESSGNLKELSRDILSSFFWVVTKYSLFGGKRLSNGLPG